LRRLITSLLIFLGLTVSAITGGPHMLPQTTLNNLTAAILERGLGYAVTIAGPSELALFPTFRLHARGVSARASSGSVKDTPALFDLGAVVIEIDTVSLLYNRVRINLVRLESPVLRLHVDADGRKNWQRRKIDQPNREPPHLDRDWGWWNEFDIAEVELRNARVLMVDRTRRWRLEAENIGLASSKPVNTTSGPGFALAGSARINGESLSLRIETGAISKALAGGRFPVVFDMQGATMALRYQGAAAKRQVFVSEGTLSLRIPDIPHFQQWLGTASPLTTVGGSLSAAAQLDISGDRYTLSNIDLNWPGSEVRGDISASLRNDSTLAVDGDLHIDTLDFGALGGETVLASAAAFLPDKLTGQVTIDWQRFRRANLEAGQGRALLKFTTGTERWTIEATTEHLYGGRGKASIRWGMAEGMASLKAGFRLSRVDAGKVLARGENRSPIAGTADVSLDLFSVGGTPEELLAALGGQGRFNVINGTLLDPGLVRYLSGGADSLSFSQLLGSFEIGQGIGSTKDLLLRTSNMSLVGAGEVDLAKAYVNIDLRSITRASTSSNRPAVKPFRIEGPIAALTIEQR
jgi:uncharacterized protein involved in outer membrane biogenesis